jgi:integrase
VLWRAGLRVEEALALTEHDLDQRRGSLLVRRGKGGRRREVGTTSIYLQGIDPEEIITAVRARRAPMMSATAGFRL